MVTVERMTAGALRRGGIDGVTLTLLAEQALLGHGRARRALERAAGSEMTVVLPGDDDPCPLEFPNDERRRRGILVAPVPLVRGLRWEDDTLYGEFPDTIAQAAVGRPLGEVLGHPDADPRTTTLAPKRPGGLVSVERMVIEPPVPTLGDRLRHVACRLRLLLNEGRMAGPAPAWAWRAMLLVTMICAAAVAVRVRQGPQDAFDVAIDAMLAGATLHSAWGVFNLRRRRPFSMLHAAMAETRHDGELEEIRRERGEAHG